MIPCGNNAVLLIAMAFRLPSTDARRCRGTDAGFGRTPAYLPEHFPLGLVAGGGRSASLPDASRRCARRARLR